MEKYLVSISQCLALEAFKHLAIPVTIQIEVICEFRKNPNKFTTLEEFLERCNELKISSQFEQHVKD